MLIECTGSFGVTSLDILPKTLFPQLKAMETYFHFYHHLLVYYLSVHGLKKVFALKSCAWFVSPN